MKKEEMLQVIEAYENRQKDVWDLFLFPEKTTLMQELRSLTESMKETAQELLDSLLYILKEKIRKVKNKKLKNRERNVRNNLKD